MSSRSTAVTRRDLIGGAATLGVGLAAGIIPVHSEATARKRRIGANDKVTIALIGCGGMGPENLRQLMKKEEVQVAALCDCDSSHLPKHVQEVEDAYSKKPDTYGDFRKVLDRKDVDAVIIGTPDHWHAVMTIAACEAGKDVYCEKPISHDITEANAMAGAVKHFKRVVQVGTWQRSTDRFVDAVDYVRSGKLGKVVTARAWRIDPNKVGPTVPGAPPATLDYQMWNGPATWMEYAPNHVHYNWRFWLNYGTGKTGDWGVHMMDMALLAMSKDTDLPMPTQVTCYGGKFGYPDDGREFPDTVQSIMRFRDPDWILHWQTGRDFPGRPEQGVEFVSAEGKTVRAWRGGWEILDKDGTMLPKERTPHTNDHWENWVECLKSREQPRSNLASMAQTTIVCHLCNAAYESGETVEWSKEKMDIVGKPGRSANAYAREYRRPWKLPVYRI